MSNTLPAQGTVYIGNLSVFLYIDCRPGARANYIPDVEILYFIADLYTAHALDAFGRFPYERKVHIPRHRLKTLPKGDIEDIQIVGQPLQSAVTTSNANCTAAVMLR